jgi:hypothetical protein
LKCHVGIAPLLDTPFNRCKSNLKLLEYGAVGLPTIASNVTPYKDSPGLLIRKARSKDWLRALRQFEDEDARLLLAGDCQTYARQFALEDNLATLDAAFHPITKPQLMAA